MSDLPYKGYDFTDGEFDILDAKVIEIARMIALRGTGTIHTLIEFPDGQIEPIHVSVSYGAQEAQAMCEAAKIECDKSTADEKMIGYGKVENGNVEETWYRAI